MSFPHTNKLKGGVSLKKKIEFDPLKQAEKKVTFCKQAIFCIFVPEINNILCYIVS